MQFRKNKRHKNYYVTYAFLQFYLASNIYLNMFVVLQTFFLFCFKLWVQLSKCALRKKEATSPNPFFGQSCKKSVLLIFTVESSYQMILSQLRIKKPLIHLRLMAEKNTSYSCKENQPICVSIPFYSLAGNQNFYSIDCSWEKSYSIPVCKCFLKSSVWAADLKRMKKEFDSKQKSGKQLLGDRERWVIFCTDSSANMTLTMLHLKIMWLHLKARRIPSHLGICWIHLLTWREQPFSAVSVTLQS